MATRDGSHIGPLLAVAVAACCTGAVAACATLYVLYQRRAQSIRRKKASVLEKIDLKIAASALEEPERRVLPILHLCLDHPLTYYSSTPLPRNPEVQQERLLPAPGAGVAGPRRAAATPPDAEDFYYDWLFDDWRMHSTVNIDVFLKAMDLQPWTRWLMSALTDSIQQSLRIESIAEGRKISFNQHLAFTSSYSETMLVSSGLRLASLAASSLRSEDDNLLLPPECYGTGSFDAVLGECVGTETGR